MPPSPRLALARKPCVPPLPFPLWQVLVLDEADRLLELGFQAEIEEIVRACPRSRQTMLFSATISHDVAALAALSLDKPLQVKVDPTNQTAAGLQQEFVRLRPNKEHEREAVLLALATRTFKSRCIVFLGSKKQAHRVKILFGLVGLRAAELHGDLSQMQRLEALDRFREGRADFLLATDLAGRGLDIRNVQTVINYELPTELRTYIHRVGRTARAGREGRAVSIVAERDRAFLKQVLKHAHAADQVVQTRTVPTESLSHWVARLAALEPQVSEVMEEEGTDKVLRAAEMEATKASNLLTHREEIMSRPARTWFQSSNERAAAKELAPRTARAAVGGEGGEAGEGGGASNAAGKRKRGADKERDMERKPIKRDKYAGMPRKKRRRLQRDELLAAETDPESGDKAIKLPNQKAAARSFKAAERRAGVPLLGKRALLGASPGMSDRPAPKRQKTAAPSPAAERSPGSKPRSERRIPKKIRSHSKAKYSKPRKRK